MCAATLNRQRFLLFFLPGNSFNLEIMSMHLPHFPETTFIRVKALVALTVADICLVHDKWLTFIVLLVIAIGLEFLYRSLHEVLLHNHEIDKMTEKIAQRKAHQKAMEEAGIGKHA